MGGGSKGLPNLSLTTGASALMQMLGRKLSSSLRGGSLCPFCPPDIQNRAVPQPASNPTQINHAKPTP